MDIGNIHKKNMKNQGSASLGTVNFGVGSVFLFLFAH